MDPEQLVAARTLELDGALNLRDLGGLPTTDGRWVRRGEVLRGAYPGFADPTTSPQAAAQVAGLGLRSVVDLRRATEAETENPPWADHGVTWLRWPLVAAEGDSWTARYAAYLATRPETVVGAARAVMDPAQRPTLFHCAAGKDRTGTLAALLLDVLGVPAEVVVADYAHSALAVAAVLDRLRDRPPYDAMLAGTTLDTQTPRAGTMADFLAGLAEQGGAEAWLVAHGVPQAEIDAFRDDLLEDPPA